ncbi:MAG: hypothetical protein BGO78_16825 [Chloroflexi bacterium 44-23]|nr:MAG: hypothetical protein BGO78_16825 [Chloroflexi bacterium 44-23]
MAKNIGAILPGDLIEATSSLAENIVQSEVFLRFKQSNKSLQFDAEAMALLSEFSELQSKLRSTQLNNSISEKDIQRLRNVQGEILTNDSIQEKELAEENAVAFVREINQEISGLLGFDFATFARRSSGCC